MSDTGTATVDVFVRSLAPTNGLERQRAVIDRLDRLESDGAIDGYDVHVWGEAVAVDAPLSATETGRGVRTRVAAFQQWALAENVSVQPFFERTERSSAMTGDEQTVITLPSITVAEREKAELVGMAPHRSEGEVVSVLDYLDELEHRRTGIDAETAMSSSRMAIPSDD